MVPAAASTRFAFHMTVPGLEECELALHVKVEHGHSERNCFAAVDVLKTSFQDCLQETCDVQLTASHLVAWQLVMAEHNCLVVGHQQLGTRYCPVHQTKGCHPTSRLLSWWVLGTHVR